MNDLNSGKAKAWNINSSSNPGPCKSLGSSMNAISFGFVATAILISMFLIMAIFEHLFRPNASHDDSSGMEATQMHKLNGTPEAVQTSHASDVSVLMPGQQYPTFIAQPAPLPCPREGLHWPPHLIDI